MTMNKSRLFFLIYVIVIISCSNKPDIIRKIEIYPETTNGEKILFHYMDQHYAIHITPLQPKDWQEILKHPHYSNKERRTRRYRIPDLQFYRIIITNKNPRPIQVGDITLHYGNVMKNKVTVETINKKYTSPLYDIFNFKTLFTWRKLATAVIDPAKIEYGKTIESKMNHIPEGNSVISFLAFEWVPVQYKDYLLRVQLNDAERKKSIDFKLTKSEYRSEGNFFLESNKKTE